MRADDVIGCKQHDGLSTWAVAARSLRTESRACVQPVRCWTNFINGLAASSMTIDLWHRPAWLGKLHLAVGAAYGWLLKPTVAHCRQTATTVKSQCTHLCRPGYLLSRRLAFLPHPAVKLPRRGSRAGRRPSRPITSAWRRMSLVGQRKTARVGVMAMCVGERVRSWARFGH